MIKLVQFPRYGSFPNMSPFCCKLETYLRMAKIPYENKFTFNPRRAPKGKLPVILDGDKTIADSHFIIEHLVKNHGSQLDKHLSAEQRAQALAFQRLIEDNLLFGGLYFRWVDETAWAKFRPKIFSKLPVPLRWFIPGLLHKDMTKRLLGQGMGRHSRSEIFGIIREDLQALSTFLGKNDYFFNNKPSSLNAICFGMVGNLYFEDCVDELRPMVGEFPNLAAHVERIYQTYYPEMAAQTKAGLQ